MALDGIFLRHIKSEIEKEALGARVSQIYQPNREELVFGLRTFSGNKKLLLSARANSPRVNFCSSTPENPAQPPMFCMLLRKRIGRRKAWGFAATCSYARFRVRERTRRYCDEMMRNYVAVHTHNFAYNSYHHSIAEFVHALEIEHKNTVATVLAKSHKLSAADSFSQKHTEHRRLCRIFGC